MLDKKFFDRVGLRVRDKYRKHIFAKARDVYGKAFKGYTDPYKKMKSKGNNFRQDRTYANTHAPVFTGDLLRDYGMIGTPSSTGFKIGWTSQGAKIKWLKKLGRVLTSSDQPLPKGIMRYIDAEVHRFIKNKVCKKKTTIHKIG